MEREVDINRLWKRLFGEQDQVEFKKLTEKEFEKLIKFLEGVNTHDLEWEADPVNKRIILWKPKEDTRKVINFLLLLSCLNIKELDLLEARRKNESKTISKES